MVTRLNQWTRQKIVSAAIAESFDTKFEAHKRAEHEIGMRFYGLVISPAELKLVAKLPEKWKARDACLRFNVGGMRMTFRVDPPVVVPSNGGDCHGIGGIAEPEDVTVAEAHFDALKDLKTERDRARAALAIMLDGIVNLKQLQEVWPQGRVYYEPLMAGETLPVPQVDELNKMLGLAA